MQDWKRILLVVFVLIGGTTSFAFWSFQQFDHVFDNTFENLSAFYVAISPRVHEPSSIATTTTEIATSTPTTSSDQDNEQDNIDPKFQLVFLPKPKGEDVYIGCTYEISWLASTTIKSLETVLIDAGTRKPTGPITSGLDKENNIEADSQSLQWKVGVAWPGEYFISISNVNGTTTDERSRKFIINEMPNGANKKEQKILCKETGGNLF
ncbi:MAG: hypothetical protein HYT28_03350 [Parcubacteria group bacterium]|nr:hypothetical protein [Parcubacteria group bacterium]